MKILANILFFIGGLLIMAEHEESIWITFVLKLGGLLSFIIAYQVLPDKDKIIEQ